MRPNALAEWIFNFVVLIFATGSIAQPFVIPSASMEGTLMTGDHVLVDKLAYGPADAFSRHLLPYSAVKRGDIVVFRYPVDEKQMFVKRVVGVPGDRIRLVDREVWRDGERVDEKYVQHIFPQTDFYRDNFPNAVASPGELTPGAEEMLARCVRGGDLVVPEGSYFVLGDNRDNSRDSRYWGLVPEANIVGKPALVWWSYQASGEELTDFLNVPHMLDMATHFFSKTRWDRTMRVVRAAS